MGILREIGTGRLWRQSVIGISGLALNRLYFKCSAHCIFLLTSNSSVAMRAVLGFQPSRNLTALPTRFHFFSAGAFFPIFWLVHRTSWKHFSHARSCQVGSQGISGY